MHDLRERNHGHTHTYCVVSVDGSEEVTTSVVLDSENPEWVFKEPRKLYVCCFCGVAFAYCSQTSSWQVCDPFLHSPHSGGPFA